MKLVPPDQHPLDEVGADESPSKLQPSLPSDAQNLCRRLVNGVAEVKSHS